MIRHNAARSELGECYCPRCAPEFNAWATAAEQSLAVLTPGWGGADDDLIACPFARGVWWSLAHWSERTSTRGCEELRAGLAARQTSVRTRTSTTTWTETVLRAVDALATCAHETMPRTIRRLPCADSDEAVRLAERLAAWRPFDALDGAVVAEFEVQRRRLHQADAVGIAALLYEMELGVRHLQRAWAMGRGPERYVAMHTCGVVVGGLASRDGAPCEGRRTLPWATWAPWIELLERL